MEQIMSPLQIAYMLIFKDDNTDHFLNDLKGKSYSIVIQCNEHYIAIDEQGNIEGDASKVEQEALKISEKLKLNIIDGTEYNDFNMRLALGIVRLVMKKDR
jgi:hypothetical protein